MPVNSNFKFEVRKTNQAEKPLYMKRIGRELTTINTPLGTIRFAALFGVVEKSLNVAGEITLKNRDVCPK